MVAQPGDMRLLGVRFVGVTSQNAHRLETTLIFIAVLIVLRYGLVWTMRLIRGGRPNERVVFWTRQGANLVTAVLVILGLLSIWLSDFMQLDRFTPQVFYRLTDNWIEMTLRFITRPRGVRNVKDEMSRRILQRFEEEHLELASGTYEVVGFPPIRIEGPVAERVANALEERAPTPARR